MARAAAPARQSGAGERAAHLYVPIESPRSYTGGVDLSRALAPKRPHLRAEHHPGDGQSGEAKEKLAYVGRARRTARVQAHTNKAGARPVGHRQDGAATRRAAEVGGKAVPLPVYNSSGLFTPLLPLFNTWV